MVSLFYRYKQAGKKERKLVKVWSDLVEYGLLISLGFVSFLYAR
jgi:hypothetical protein